MSFHLYNINELYSNPSGTIQFIELTTSASGQAFWSGVTISTTRGGVTNSYTFPSNLPGTATANTAVLIATQGFADLGLVSPNYIVPDGFLFPAGGVLDFGGADQVNYAALPTDGVHSVTRTGAEVNATPKNFAGVSATLPTPTATPVGTSAADTLTGSTASELIDGLAGNDTIRDRCSWHLGKRT